MIRFWRKRHDARLDTGGRQARERAEKALAETRAETPQIARFARELREIRRRNHLAEAFLQAARRGHD